MASTIDLSGLEHYINTLEKYKVLLKNFYKAMEMLCQEAQRYAEQEYSQYGRTDITVGYDNDGKRATIYARSINSNIDNPSQIAFYEFGTGRVGENTYQGTKPQSGVPITGEWKYYYPSKAKRTSRTTGEEGWWWDNTFQRGIQAEAEMWKTSQFIRQQAKYIIQNYFQNESGAV